MRHPVVLYLMVRRLSFFPHPTSISPNLALPAKAKKESKALCQRLQAIRSLLSPYRTAQERVTASLAANGPDQPRLPFPPANSEDVLLRLGRT